LTIQLGRSRTVRRAYGIDEIALVPGGRTVDPDVVDSSWTLGGIEREIPIIASAMDGVVDPGMAIELSRLGALGVLNLEGVQCRYDDPNPVLDRIAAVGKEEVVPLMQELYSQPVREDLIRRRIAEIKEKGGIAAVSATPVAALKFGCWLRLAPSCCLCRPRWSPPSTSAPQAGPALIWRPSAATWGCRSSWATASPMR